MFDPLLISIDIYNFIRSKGRKEKRGKMSSCDSLSEYDEEEDAREREQAALQWVLDQRESSPSKVPPA